MSKELKITKERIKKLADGLSSCPEAQEAIQKAFPEAFKGEEEWKDITDEVKIYLENRSGGFRYKIETDSEGYFKILKKRK